MPLRVYCDQNFLIQVGHANGGYKNRLSRMITDGQICFVVSAFHWLEMARGANPANGLALADFVDSLNPLWLRERKILQTHEVAAQFYQWLNIAYARPSALTSRSELISDLSGSPIAATQPLQSRDFVQELQSNAATREHIEKPYKEAAQARRAIFEGLRNGKITAAQIHQADREFFEHRMPQCTPAGLAIDKQTHDKFLDQVDTQDFPAIAVEFGISTDGWKAIPDLNWNTFVDEFHVIPAIPYVDIFATDDIQLTKIVQKVKPSLRFPIACPITKERFDRLYLP